MKYQCRELFTARKAYKVVEEKAGKALDKARIKADRNFVKDVDNAGKVRKKALALAWENFEKSLEPVNAACNEAHARDQAAANGTGS